MTERDAGIGQDGGRLCGPQKLQLKEEESPTECSGCASCFQHELDEEHYSTSQEGKEKEETLS